MQPKQFQTLITPVIEAIAGKPVDKQLETELNQRFPANEEPFKVIQKACHAAIAAGWMCANGEGKRRFGRIIEATPASRALSVDVVDLTDIIGPHHRHPNGEICMVMPVDADARFDGRGAGWKVYQPDSAHRPTVTEGRALVLYLLPDGAIEFTGQ